MSTPLVHDPRTGEPHGPDAAAAAALRLEEDRAWT